jgi:hypothetical protein
MIIDNDMKSSRDIVNSFVVKELHDNSKCVISYVRYFCRKCTHFKNVMIILHCNYVNDMGKMLTKQKTKNKQLH